MGQFFVNPNGMMYKNKDHIKYIQDYETELIQDEKGKYRKKVTYIGPYIPFLLYVHLIHTFYFPKKAHLLLIDILEMN